MPTTFLGNKNLKMKSSISRVLVLKPRYEPKVCPLQVIDITNGPPVPDLESLLTIIISFIRLIYIKGLTNCPPGHENY